MTDSIKQAVSLSYVIKLDESERFESMNEEGFYDIYVVDYIYIDATVTFKDGSARTYKIVGTLDVGEYKDTAELDENVSDQNGCFNSDIEDFDEDSEFEGQYEAMLEDIKSRTNSNWQIVKYYLDVGVDEDGDVICKAHVVTNERNTSRTTHYKLKFFEDQLLDDDVLNSDADYFSREISEKDPDYIDMKNAIAEAVEVYQNKMETA